MEKNWVKIINGDSRRMKEVDKGSVDLIVTSPPYWHIKDYGISGQIGYGQSLHEYLKGLYYVWNECYRVVREGGRFCLNIGDQFARSIIYGRYKIIPIHAEFIAQCEQIGFDFMGSIIWQKKTTMNTSGGANIMGSYPYPTNGIVEIDYEYILIFKKVGKGKKVSKDIKEKSKLTKEEWKKYFSGHWYFGGARQLEHEAMFPDELPRRLIKMFTFVGDTVLDPFTGSGTTLKVAVNMNRNVIGYEINKKFIEIIKEKIGVKDNLPEFYDLEIINRKGRVEKIKKTNYIPRIQDAKPKIDPKKFKFNGDKLYKVVKTISEDAIELDTGLITKFLGVSVDKKEEAINYFNDYIVGRDVFLKFDGNKVIDRKTVNAYVYLKNKIFINYYLIKSGLGSPDCSIDHKFRDKFIKLYKER